VRTRRHYDARRQHGRLVRIRAVGGVTDVVRDVPAIIALGMPGSCWGVTPDPHRRAPRRVRLPPWAKGVAVGAGDLVTDLRGDGALELKVPGDARGGGGRDWLAPETLPQVAGLYDLHGLARTAGITAEGRPGGVICVCYPKPPVVSSGAVPSAHRRAGGH
jgi:hypothetical protein